jgi:hypothetical protein
VRSGPRGDGQRGRGRRDGARAGRTAGGRQRAPGGGAAQVWLDTSIVSSDVHEFTELLRLAEKLDPPHAIEADEAALALYGGDLLDSSDIPNYRWMYDESPQVALTLRSDFRRQHKEARLRLAELLARGPEEELGRAEELYSSLCAEDLEDERLWIALFRIHERSGRHRCGR